MKVLICSIIISVLFITGCQNEGENSSPTKGLCHCDTVENCACKNLYQTVTSKQAKDLIYNSNTFLVDVRSEAEYNSGHLDGALNIPLDEIEDINFSKTLNFIVYCRSGSRSKMAAEKLLKLGYVNVYDLGSMDNWQE